MSEDNLSKVANECADKLKGLEAVIPPVPAKRRILKIALEPLPFQTFTVNHSHPVDNPMLVVFEVLCGAAGLVMLGIVLALGFYR